MFKTLCIKIMLHKVSPPKYSLDHVGAVWPNPKPHMENTDQVSLCVNVDIKIIVLLQIKSLRQKKIYDLDKEC